MESGKDNDTRQLCGNCHSFYGTKDTDFLCSKCFREQAATEKKEAEAKSPIKELVKEVAEAVQSQQQIEKPVEPSQEEPKEPEAPVIEEKPVEKADVQMKDEETKEEVKEEAPKVQENKGKCWDCNRKVGLVQTECKCGYVYCPKHRHSEAHNCTYDYHAQQKALLEKNNPQILHKKLEKMF